MFRSNRHKYFTGFGLVELMVGIVVGLLSILVVMKMASVFSQQKNTTSANADAQQNGMMAMMVLERELHNAGAGLPADALNCDNSSSNFRAFRGNAAIAVQAASFVAATIKDGGTGANNSDTLSVPIVSGNAGMTGGVPIYLTAATADGLAELNVSRLYGVSVGDLMLVVDDTGGSARKCSLIQVTSVTNTETPFVKRIQHAAGVEYSGTVNAHSNKSLLFNLGNVAPPPTPIGARSAMRTDVYSVVSNNLQVTSRWLGDTAVSPAAEIAREIINMQAQYGIESSTTPGTVSQWVDATGATWTTPSNANLQRIIAIRLVVVARSGKRAMEDVTEACSNNANGPCAWQDDLANAPKINLSADSDWKKYRYRIYQTVIPFRNAIWAGL